jgi:hypothetical protein
MLRSLVFEFNRFSQIGCQAYTHWNDHCLKCMTTIVWLTFDWCQLLETLTDCDRLQCEAGPSINALFDLLYRPPYKVMIIGAGCSAACIRRRKLPFIGISHKLVACLWILIQSFPLLPQRSKTAISCMLHVWTLVIHGMTMRLSTCSSPTAASLQRCQTEIVFRTSSEPAPLMSCRIPREFTSWKCTIGEKWPFCRNPMSILPQWVFLYQLLELQPCINHFFRSCNWLDLRP